MLRTDLPRVMHEADAAVLVVDLENTCVEYANLRATAMAGDVTLPVGVDEWGRLAGLVGLDGGDLSETVEPLSRLVRGEAVAGELVRREPARASGGAAGERDRQRREGAQQVDDVAGPLWVTGFPLGEAMTGRALLVFMRLEAPAGQGLPAPAGEGEGDGGGPDVGRAIGSADVAGTLQDRAVIATDLSFTISDPSLPGHPLVWVNPAFGRTTGYAPEDVLGVNCRLLQGPGTDPETVARMSAALARGEGFAETLLNYRKDGTAFWNQVSVSPVLDAEGALVNFVGVQVDVTQRVLVERERQRALRAEQRSRAGLALLDRVSDAVIELDAGEALDRLTRVLTETVAPWAVVLVPGRDVEVVAAAGAGLEDLVGSSRRVRGPGPADLAGADPLRAVCQDVTQEQEVDLAGTFAEPGTTAWFAGLVDGRAQGRYAALPLPGRDSVVAVLLVGLGGGPAPGPIGPDAEDGERPAADDPDYRRVLRVAARRTGLVLENARLHQREHLLAETLQRSMLPRHPGIAGLDVWAHYRPNSEHAQVGGDWYDVVPIRPGVTGLAVGDVVGHDVEAAATMGQLRSVVRSFAFELEDPGSVLMRVDSLAAGMDMARLASLVLMTLTAVDEGRWSLSWSSAGHLPPLLARPVAATAAGEGDRYEVQRLDGARGLLVGLGEEPRTSDRVDLAPGDVLVAYTDGLVERRDRPLRAGVEELVAALAAGPGGRAEQVGRRLLESMGGSPDDDTAVVVLRVPREGDELPAGESQAPRERRWRLPSDASSVGRARHATLRACAAWGVERSDLAEVVVSELVANAVMHGWGIVEVRLYDLPDGLRLEVSDSNPEPPRLVSPRPMGAGGNGLHVVAQVARWGFSPTRTGKLVWAELRSEQDRRPHRPVDPDTPEEPR